MLNKIFLMGRLTRDPELRRTQAGTAVASFSLAVDRDHGKKGEDKETDFIDIVAWRNTAEFVSKYFGKRRSAEVIADNIYFGDSKKPDSGRAGAEEAPGYGGENYGYSGGGGFEDLGDEDKGDLPF